MRGRTFAYTDSINCLIMEQNKQGTQSPETQQTKKPENAGQNQQSTPQNQQQNSQQNQQPGMKNQQSSSKDKAFNPSSPAYGSDQGEDERPDDRQQDADQGSFTSQRNQSGAGGDQEKLGNKDNENESDRFQRSNTPGQEKGNNQGQQKSGGSQGSSGSQR